MTQEEKQILIMEPNKWVESIFSSFITSVFNPLLDNVIVPPMPIIDSDIYNHASEDEKVIIIEKAVNEDPFWGRFFEKIKDKNSYKSLITATRDIDAQIIELNKKRWDIIKEWVMNKNNIYDSLEDTIEHALIEQNMTNDGPITEIKLEQLKEDSHE